MFEVPQTRFNAQDSKYMCLCNHVHVKSGTQAYGVFLATNAAFQLVNAIAAGAVMHSLLSLLISVLLVATLAQGLHKERAGLLIPTFIVQGLAVMFVGIMAFFVLLTVFLDGDYLKKQCMRATHPEPCLTLVGMRGALFVLTTGVLLFNIWIASIIGGCYRYFKDKAACVQSMYDAERR